ncbi:hypothetical protein [Isoptericola sp. AK164]|uniref:hypothetical protein n=1 Tax=Isoptericola sp. AK164 TaxID=3024246 RepID=UPI0024182449|nr:hypothetical protein [Isoptericola sp. AK164]
MSTKTLPEKAAAVAELEEATSAAAEAESAARDVSAAVEAGTVTDPAEFEQAESRKRFAFLRRKGAQARVAAAEAAERAEALEALDAAVSGYDGPERIRAAREAFGAAVEDAAARYAAVVSKARTDAGALLAQARTAGVEQSTQPEARQAGLQRFLFGDQLFLSGAGRAASLKMPFPAKHSDTERDLTKTATNALRRGLTNGGN